MGVALANHVPEAQRRRGQASEGHGLRHWRWGDLARHDGIVNGQPWLSTGHRTPSGQLGQPDDRGDGGATGSRARVVLGLQSDGGVHDAKSASQPAQAAPSCERSAATSAEPGQPAPTAPARATGPGQQARLLLFAFTSFWSALLLFLVQPAVAKMLLPRLGGSAAVWTTCMVFFQAMLLFGYLYAHLLGGLVKRSRVALAIHALVLLLPLAGLPLAIPDGSPGDVQGHPVTWLLWTLALAVGPSFFVVATTAPLLQRWFSLYTRSEVDPYRLYAASNAGSLLALLCYPVLIEPLAGLRLQSQLWSAGYIVFVALVGGCAVIALGRASDRPALAAAMASPRPTRAQQARWLFLSFVPVSLMLGTTQHLSTDIAAVPLLWVVPLALYIVTFILAFGRAGLLAPARCARLLPFAAMAAGAVQGTPYPMALVIPVHLLLMFIGAQLCHGRLAELRPGPDQLTRFYLLVALGGVLAGLGNAIVAPLLFDDVIEYPVAILLACLAARPVVERPASATIAYEGTPSAGGSRPWAIVGDLWPVLLLVALPLLLYLLPRLGFFRSDPLSLVLLPLSLAIVVLLRARPAKALVAIGLLLFVGIAVKRVHPSSLHLARSFFNVHHVWHDPGTQSHVLIHGGTVHGLQSTLPDRKREPTFYYFPQGPVGQFLAAYQARGGFPRVAVMGLGIGMLAAYGRVSDNMIFYEIDPAIIDTARNPRLFSYLADSKARIAIVEGDARQNLARSPDRSLDLIVMDAFSSDSIPVHLITREAMAVYLRKLAPAGVILVHISNRYFELRPVVAALAAELRLVGRLGSHRLSQDELTASPLTPPTSWVALARQAVDLAPLDDQPSWRALGSAEGVMAWTDDHANVLSAMRWW